MQASNAPSKSPVPFAESGTKNTIPVDSQIGVTPGAASFTDGFPPLTMTPLTAGGVPPSGADFNGIFNFLSAAVRWAQAGGQYKYDADFATAVGGYPRGATLVSSDGTGTWRSIAENNTTDPDSGAAGWVAAATAGLAGMSSNLRCTVNTAAASVTFTADEVVVAKALGGQSYRVANVNKTLNLATTGAGGMDVGSAPNNGFVAVYVIYNPANGTSALLAVNATSAAAPTVYGGSSMPAGYTASALVSVLPTNGSGQIPVLFQQDRKISFALKTVLTSTTPNGDPGSSLAISSAVPINAKTVDMGINLQQSALSGNTGEGCAISSSASLIKQQFVQVAGNGVTQIVGWCGDIPIITPQTVWYSWRKFGATTDDALNIYVTAYSF